MCTYGQSKVVGIPDVFAAPTPFQPVSHGRGLGAVSAVTGWTVSQSRPCLTPHTGLPSVAPMCPVPLWHFVFLLNSTGWLRTIRSLSSSFVGCM